MIAKRNDLIYKLLGSSEMEDLQAFVVKYTAFKQNNIQIAFKFLARFELKETLFPDLMRIRRKVFNLFSIVSHKF
jgi:hypothetical protein